MLRIFDEHSNSFIVSIYCRARIDDIEFNIITRKDSNTSPLPSWSIIARNDIIRHTKLKFTFKPSFIEGEGVNIILF